MRKRGRRGAGTIYQLPDGRWCGQASITVAGERHRPTVYASSFRAAQVALATEINKFRPDQACSLSDYLDTWLSQVSPTVAHSTAVRYGELVAGITEKLGHLRLDALRPQHVEALLSDSSPDRARKRLVVLRMALKSALRGGRIASNPADLVRLPRVVKRQVKILTPEQIGRLLASGDPYLHLWATLLDSGCRLGEVLALTWHDISIETRVVTITKCLSEVGGHLAVKEPKTRAGRRSIQLTPGTVQLIVAKRHDSPLNLVFPAPEGGYWRSGNLHRRAWAPLKRKLGLPDLRIHDLRHTSGSLYLAASASPKLVQERLGHSTIQLTLDVYAHLLPRQHGAAVEKVSEILK